MNRQKLVGFAIGLAVVVTMIAMLTSPIWLCWLMAGCEFAQ